MEKKLYFECYSGISGDMAVAALLDLGADEKVLMDVLDSLPVQGFTVQISRVKKSALDACDFAVQLDAAHENHDHDMQYLYGDSYPDACEAAGHVHAGAEDIAHTHEEHAHTHEEHAHTHGEHMHAHAKAAHSHGGHTHTHRSLADIEAIIQAAQMTEHAKELAGRIFHILARAEAAAHGVPMEQVHFHEVGAVDSIVDIISIAVCVDNLGIDKVAFSELYEGSGFVRCQHGRIPVPVPAVVNIAAESGLKLHLTGDAGEFVTPTGAALAAALKTQDTPPKSFQIEKIGIGAGKRQTSRPGILRVMRICEEQ